MAVSSALPLSDNHLTAVKAFYRTLSAESLSRLAAIYHRDIVFTDPAGSIHGIDDLQRHFTRLLQNTRQCRCEFLDEQQILGDESAVLFWRMTLIADNLASGRPFKVEGVSRLQYQGDLIIHHRDYFDLGALLYEQLPLLGSLVRRLRKRLALRP